MNKTGIEWCDFTWNPVTGCYHNCEYCYARRIAERFGVRGAEAADHKAIHTVEKKLKGNPYPYIFEPTFLPYKLVEPARKKAPQNIFVCSMADLFGKWVPDDWILDVFDACEQAPRHNYLFLTKNPERYVRLDLDGELPARPNMWYGATVTKPEDPFPFSGSHNIFLSVEPMLAPFSGEDLATLTEKRCRGDAPDWIIIGAMTGPLAGPDTLPQAEWIEDLAKDAETAGIPVFMKDSLVPIMGEANMLRQFPRGLQHG